MKYWLISDTHQQHQELHIPNVDCVIHCGDCTNAYNPIQNQIEFENFYNWFVNLPIKHKILIAGNHDASLTKSYNIDKLKANGIVYLENEYYEVGNVKLYGSPISPTFGNWYFMKDRSKMQKVWQHLEYVNILITHTPPKGILDLSYSTDNKLEYCGCKSLLNKITEIQPKIHCFGHIHDYNDILNYGTRTIGNWSTTFYNCAVVEDGKIEQGVKHHGHIIEL